jgi:hypothetical protein
VRHVTLARRWPRVLAVLAAGAGMLALVCAAPGPALHLLAKEGPLEQASHLVVLLAVLAWTWLAARCTGGARLRAALLAAFLLLVLAEEIDWGAIYGPGAVGRSFAAVFGHRNMHNALAGSSYLLFALPLALHFAAPARLHGRLAPVVDERLAFVAIAVQFILWNLGPWERQAQELLEACVYALMLAYGVRLLRQ